MIICNETCQLYYKCDCRNLRQRCIFDLGMPYENNDNDDEFIDKLTY